jgi:hypothetical protein
LPPVTALYGIQKQIALAVIVVQTLMINPRGRFHSRIARLAANYEWGETARTCLKGAMRAQNPSENAARYLGGLRMLKPKPAHGKACASASRKSLSTSRGIPSWHGIAQRSTVTSILGAGA